MGRLDIEGLMQPISSGSPCGDNLEYDPVFGELERAASGIPEQVIGNAVTKAEPPDWPAVVRMASELFLRTKDLRVAMRLTRALLITQGIPGFDEGLALIAQLLVGHWDELHPQLDPEDDNDPTLRVNIVSELCSPETILKDLRSTPLARAQALGSVNYRHVALAAGELTAVDGSVPKDMAEVRAVFLGCDAEELLLLATAARGCVRHLVAIEDVLTRKVSVTRAIDLAPVLTLTRKIAEFVEARVAERGLIVASDASSADVLPGSSPGAPGDGAPAARVAMPAEVTSRDDVVRLLDRICAYYERYEPSSPVPLLLVRARRLVSMNFIDALRDIAPDAVAQAEAIRGQNTP